MMEFRPGMGFVLGFCIVASAAGSTTGAVAEENAPGSASTQSEAAGEAVSATGYTSAFACGRCHVDIYNSWKRSMHSMSLSDPIFDVALMQAVKADPAAKALCLKCHAPVTLTNRDLDLTQGITREGVTCDFCHTVTSVKINDPKASYVQDLGRVKRGTIARASSPAHDVVYSDLHASAEFCGACHYHESDNGTVVMGTYAEWKNGPYARDGVRCQDCHMVLARGRVVLPEIKEGGKQFNLHDLIHDTDQLKNALEVRIADLASTTGGVLATVEVTNIGSGHMIPTGIPNRKVVLHVEALLPDGTTSHQEKIYQKVVGGPNGEALTLDYETFLYARSILSDNRIGPKEKRVESFFFRTEPNARVEVSATATYEYAPLVLDKRAMTITLSSDTRVAAGSRRAGTK